MGWWASTIGMVVVVISASASSVAWAGEPDATTVVTIETKKESSLDIIPYAGMMMPRGALQPHAKNGTLYGVGIGKAFWIAPQGEVRISLFGSATTKLATKDSDLEGTLNIQVFDVRADYVFYFGAIHPYAGSGFGMYRWNATITQKATESSNTARKDDVGAVAALGADIILHDDLYLAPEVAYHDVGGDFSEPLLTSWLSLRWRI